MSQQPGAVPPGWYEHPQEPGSVRYWDGAQWTELPADSAMGGVAARLPEPETRRDPAEPAAAGGTGSEDADEAIGPDAPRSGGRRRAAQPALLESPVARKGAAIAGAAVLGLVVVGLAVTQPWDSTPDTCADAVQALASGSSDQAVLEAVTETCGTVEEFAAETEKYPGSFATGALASGIGTICGTVPDPADRPLCADAAKQSPAEPAGSPAPSA